MILQKKLVHWCMFYWVKMVRHNCSEHSVILFIFKIIKKQQNSTNSSLLICIYYVRSVWRQYTSNNKIWTKLNKRRSKITPFKVFLYCLRILSGGRRCQLFCYQLLKLLTLYWLWSCFPLIKAYRLHILLSMAFILGTVRTQSISN